MSALDSSFLHTGASLVSHTGRRGLHDGGCLVCCRLATAKRNNLKDQLMGVIANALYYNPVLALQALQQQGHLSSVMTAWFQVHPSALFHESIACSRGRGVQPCWRLESLRVYLRGRQLQPRSAVALADWRAHGSGCALQMIFAARKDGRRQHFRRQHDKKVAVLALVAVMTAPAEALPQELQAAMGQFTAGCLKLLTDLKKQQARPSVRGLFEPLSVLPTDQLHVRGIVQPPQAMLRMKALSQLGHLAKVCRGQPAARA